MPYPEYPPEYDTWSTYPKVGDVIYHSDIPAELSRVRAVWTEDDDEVPEWAGPEEDPVGDVQVEATDAEGKHMVFWLDNCSPIDNRHLVVEFDVDEATYVGDEDDGVYYQVVEYVGKWYVIVVVDSDTGGFVDTLHADDGPYDSEEAAREAGRNAATEWCAINGVAFD